MALIRFFKKGDRWEALKNAISSSFSKVRYDLQHVFAWISYFKQKHEHNDYQHHVLKNHLGEHRNAIIYLHDEIELLKNKIKLMEIDAKRPQGQLRTIQRTSQGQVKDMSLKKKDISKDTKTHVIDKSSLTGSQVELLNLLYHSDKPLSYEMIAKLLGKKEKSIRNLIYELREKGTNIETKPIAPRTKGFYLGREEKIKVSGR